MEVRPPWGNSTPCMTDQNSGIVDAVATLNAQLDTMLNNGKESRRLLENKGHYRKSFSFSRNKNVCEYCDRRFNEYSNLIKHRRIHTGSKPYKCELCAKNFTQSSNLNVHRKRCKGPDLNQPQFLATAQINKTGTSWDSKRKSIAKSVPENLNTESANTKNNEQDSGFSQHIDLSLRGISPGLVEQIKSFNICRQLQYKKCMRQENSSVANSQDGSSDVPLNSAKLKVLNSSKTSAESLAGDLIAENSNVLSNKIMQGSGSVVNNLLANRRTYPCEYCSRRFNESSNLIKHRRIHTGQRPYKCTFCGKDFTQSSNLNVHKKICKGRHFSKTALRLDSSIKFSRLSNMKFQNRFAKVPRYGAFENSQVSFSQLSSRVSDRGTGPSQDAASTSSVTGLVPHLSNVASLSSFSSAETQSSRHKYIPLSSELQNLRNEYSENNPEERFSGTNSEEICTATFTANNNRNKVYMCEFCQKRFKWLSTLNMHRQSCTKNLINNVDVSPISNDENGPTIKESTFRSQELNSFDNVTKSSFVQQVAVTDNESHIDYIVIDDESDDGNDSEIKGNVQQEFENNAGTSLHGTSELNDVKPVFIKCEPGSFPVSESVSTFDNVSLSEVDSKSFLPQIEPFSSAVLEVKQEPIEHEHSTSVNTLSVKQEICDEGYNMNQVFGQSVTFDLRVNNGSFESEMLSINPNDLRNGDQETNDQQNLMGGDQNLFLGYNSTLEPDVRNANTFRNAANQNQLGSQSIRKSFTRLQCHVPSCKNRFFKSVTAYEIHMRVHNGQKPYVCEICRKSFNERSNYTKHLRIHSGYKPYRCTLCGHAFTQSSNLNVHKRKCRGQRSGRITSSSLTADSLRSNITTTNELNTEFSESHRDSLNITGINSLQHLAHGPQNNITFLDASGKYNLDSRLGEQLTVVKNISHKDSVRNPIISVYTNKEENVTHHVYKVNGQNVVQSNHSVQPRINNSLSKPYKCSICHRAFIHLTNYNAHTAACKRRSYLIRTRNHSVAVDSEIDDTHISSKHSNGFSSSNPNTCMRSSDVDITEIESDHNRMESSAYFSNRNNLSLISTSEFPPEGQELIPVNMNIGPSLSLFESTESKINLNKTDQNSNTNADPDIENPDLSLQSASLENNKYKPFEERADNSSYLNDHPEVRPSLQIAATDEVNQNPSLSKKDDNCKDLQDQISPNSIANREKVFQCKLRNCRKSFHLASELQEHTIRHRKGGANVCKFCHKQFNESSNLIKHRRIHTGAKPYKCEFCNKFFSQSSNRNVHRKSCSKSFARNPVSFSSTSNPGKMPVVIKPNRLECEMCQQRFQRASDLYKHKNFCRLKDGGQSGNVTEKKSEICSDFSAESTDYQPPQTNSPKPSENPNEQSSHLRGENLLASPSHKNLAIPLGSVSPQKQLLNGQYMFQCPFGQCGKIFKMALVLRRHIVKDHGMKQQYSCEVCGDRFHSLDHLSQHQEIHSGQKQFRCGSCDKNFIQFSQFNNHRKICNASSAANNLNYSSEDLAVSDRQKLDELAEKSNSNSDLEITRITENTSKTSNVESYNHVINIDDNDEDDGLETVQPPTETALNSSVSSNYVKGDISDKTCEISSDPSSEHISGSVHVDIDSQESRIDHPDVIMIDQSPDSNLQDGGPNQKESEVKNKLSKTVDSIPEIGVTGTLLEDSVTGENDSILLSKAISWIGSDAKSNGIYNRPSLSNIQQIDTPTNSSESNLYPINKNINNWKSSTVTSFGILPNNPDSNRSFPTNASNSHRVFFCKVNSCRKALLSEEEVRMHQCKRRTYPCEYCQRRFNESSNLIKHRRVHTGHKPYKCKFCGRMFTQSSNLNVHRKVCARKHSFVEQRFTQPMPQHRNVESTESVNVDTSSTAANVNFHEIDLSEESISDVSKNKMAGASTYNIDDISNNVDGVLSSGGRRHSLHAPVVVENYETITKVEDFESGENGQQNSGIVVEDSSTGEVKLQISEKELNAFGHRKTLADIPRLTDSLIEFENLQDAPQAEYTPNQISDVLKKEYDNDQRSDITLSQHEAVRLEIASVSQMASNDVYNSTRPISDLSSRLEFTSSMPLTHKLNSYARTFKMGLQFKKHLTRRTYACEFCKRRFNESSNLIKHRRIHLGLRPYKCPHCERSFTQSSNCNVHKKICAQKRQLSGPVLQNPDSLSDTSHIDLSAVQANNISNDQTSCSDNFGSSSFPLSSDHNTASNVADSAGHYNIVSNIADSTGRYNIVNNIADSTLTTCDQMAMLSCNPNDNDPCSSSVTADHYTSMFSHNSNGGNELESSVNNAGPIFSISSVRSLKENTDRDLQFTGTKTEFTNTSYAVQGIKPALNLSIPRNHIDKNPPSLLISQVDIPDEDLTITAGFIPESNQNSLTSDTTAASRKHNFKEPFVSSQNQNRFKMKFLQCPFCPRLCKNTSDFQRHVRVHTGHKPYMCKICNKLFTDYSNLHKHRRVHTGFKPYRCNLCLRQFSQSSNLNVHKKNCKGVAHKNMAASVNLSVRSNELTSLDNRVTLNNLASQILPTNDSVKLKNSSLSFHKDRSFSSDGKSELSERRPLSRNLISKPMTSTNSKSIAQRISMKYLSKIPSRLNRNFSKDFGTNSKPQLFGSEDQNLLNLGVHIAEKTSATVPETTTYHPRQNSSDPSLTEANSCSQVEQSSNLNVHKRICKESGKVSGAIARDPESVGETHKTPCDKNMVVPDGSYRCEGDVLETPCKDLNSSQENFRNDQKQLLADRKKTPENENGSKNSVSQQTEVSNSTSTDKVSSQNDQEPDSQKVDDFILDNEGKTLRQFDKVTDSTKSPIGSKDSSKSSLLSPNNTDIFIPPPKHQNCVLLQEKSLQNIEFDVPNRHNVTENESHVSSGNTGSVDRSVLEDADHNVTENESHVSSVNTGSVDRSVLEEPDQTVLFKSITAVNNKNAANKNSQIQSKTIPTDDDKTYIQDLDVQIMDQSISDNHTGSDVNRKTYLQRPSSQNDPKMVQLMTGQSLPDQNENTNKSLINELQNLPTLSADKNSEHSNLHQPAAVNSEQLSDHRQIELIQSQAEDHGHRGGGVIFVEEPTVKQEDVFSCRASDIELVQLPSHQSDVINSINSAINGILQTEESASLVDQSSVFQNMAPDWFKIESADVNRVSPSNKSELILVDSNVNQDNNIYDDDDDVIIIGSSANFKPVKTNFLKETNRLNKSSYPAVSENDPLSSFVNTIPFQALVKTEPSNRPECVNNNENATDRFLIETSGSTDFSNCSSEKIMQSYQSDELSVQDCPITDRSLLYSEPLVPLQPNSNNFVNKNDDDIAIVDIKSTSTGKVHKDSNTLLFNSNYNPSYFNKNCNVSPAACKNNNMDTYSKDTMKEPEHRLEHIHESFDYLVPNITDQLLDDNGGRVIEVSCESKLQGIADNSSSMYACKFCQERFSTSSSLVNHSCSSNTGENSHTCPGCGKAFTSYTEAMSHKRLCMEVPVKLDDYSVFNAQKDDASQAGSYRMDTQVATIDLNQWREEYNFNAASRENMSIHGNENGIVAAQNSGQLLSVDKEKVLGSSEGRNSSHTSKYEKQLPEFSPQNLQVALNDYGCFPVDPYNHAFDSSLPGDNRLSSRNRSGPFLDNSFTTTTTNTTTNSNNNNNNNNSNPVVDISTILSSSESLPSNNTLSSSMKTLPLNKMSLSGIPPNDPNFIPVVDKHSSLPHNDYLYTHINNYHPQNDISSHTDSNVLLKDFAVGLSSDQTGKYPLSATSHHTSTSTSLSSTTSSTSFINISDPAVSVSSVPCQYCDKMLNLSELSRHTCSGTTQPNNRYACTFCEKTLCDASSLSKHLRIHTGYKPYSCEFCGKAFTQSSNLNVHKKVCKDKDNPSPAT